MTTKKPSITLVPDEWWLSLLRSDGIVTLNNATERNVFFFMFGEMSDLNVPEGEQQLQPKYYRITVHVNEGDCRQINFPSKKVKVIVGFYHNEHGEDEEEEEQHLRKTSPITTFLHRELEQSHTFNVLQKHVDNQDAIQGIKSEFINFNEFLIYIQEKHNNNQQLPEIDPRESKKY